MVAVQPGGKVCWAIRLPMLLRATLATRSVAERAARRIGDLTPISRCPSAPASPRSLTSAWPFSSTSRISSGRASGGSGSPAGTSTFMSCRPLASARRTYSRPPCASTTAAAWVRKRSRSPVCKLSDVASVWSVLIPRSISRSTAVLSASAVSSSPVLELRPLLRVPAEHEPHREREHGRERDEDEHDEVPSQRGETGHLGQSIQGALSTGISECDGGGKTFPTP